MVFFLVGGALAGCGKDNPTKVNVVQPQHPPLSTPQNVLSAMILAYTQRDSVEYKLVYHQALYLGESTDNTMPVVTTDTLRWDDEARHISGLARATDVVSVEMDFGHGWLRHPSGYVEDPPGSALIIVTNPKLAIYTTTGGLIVGDIPQMEFRFAPTVAALGDTTWKIIHWTEYR